MYEILKILQIIWKYERAMKNGAISKTNTVSSEHMNCVVYGDEQGYNPEYGYKDYEMEAPITSEYVDGSPLLSCWYRKYDNSTMLPEVHLLYEGTERIHAVITAEGWKEVKLV